METKMFAGTNVRSLNVYSPYLRTKARVGSCLKGSSVSYVYCYGARCNAVKSAFNKWAWK